jgi:hypothetical protein
VTAPDVFDVDLARRGRILLTMLVAARFRYPADPEPEVVRLLRGWFASWPGIGRIVVGMTRQGFDLQLTQYDREGWRATLYPEGRAHSITQAVGSAYERTPWGAVVHAALVTLGKVEGALQGSKGPPGAQK